MRQHVLLALACIALATTAPLCAQVPATDADTTASVEPRTGQSAGENPEEVLVTGERPGPGLWKVSKGDHTMWILGTHAPLPKELTWRSTEVEAIMAASRQFMIPGGARPDIDVGFFQAVTLFPSMLRAGKIPEDGKLRDILPAETYARWQVLQQKYMPHDTVETMRPTFAAQSLQNNAFIRSGLGGDAGVRSALKKLARKHRVKTTTLPVHEVELKVKGGKAILKEFSQTPLIGVDCLTKTVDQLETGLETLRVRANAWATGDVETLRSLLGRKSVPDCAGELFNALLNSGFGQHGAQDLARNFLADMQRASEEAHREWLEATESAISKNEATFAVMPIGDLLRPNGYVSQLRNRGYTVEEPGQ